MSAQGIILSKERKLTRFDFFKKTKHEVKLLCADHGLLTMGKKADLIDQLFDFLHPHSSFEHPSEKDDDGSSYDEEGVGQRNNGGNAHKAKPNDFTLDSICTHIQQELAAQRTARSLENLTAAQLSVQGPLSPASLNMHSATAVGYFPSQTGSSQASQGVSPIVDYKKPQSLPPVSEKLLNDITNCLQFVDFNSLLPNALYDPMVGTEIYYLL